MVVGNFTTRFNLLEDGIAKRKEKGTVRAFIEVTSNELRWEERYLSPEIRYLESCSLFL